MLRSSTIFEQTLSKPVLIFWPFLISIFFNSLKLKVLIHKTIIWCKSFFFFFFYIADSLDLFMKKDFFPYMAISTVKQLIVKQTSVERQEASAASLQPVCLRE